MPIVSPIGRRHPKVRALYAGMYAFLILGAVSMVYPFLLMISGSTKSAVDIKYFDAVPEFLHSDVWLYRKHSEALFNETMTVRNAAYDRHDVAFDVIEPPSIDGVGPWVDAWRDFLENTDLPPYASALGHLYSPVSKTMPRYLRVFKQTLKSRFGNRIDDVNRAIGAGFISWNGVTLLNESYLLRRERPRTDPLSGVVNDIKASAPDGMRYYFSLSGHYKYDVLRPLYTRDIDEYNRINGTAHTSYDDIVLPRFFPEEATEREQANWEIYVRETLSLAWIRSSAESAASYRAYLRDRYGAIETLNRAYNTAYASFDDIPAPTRPLDLSGRAASDWEAFLVGWDDPETGESHRIDIRHVYLVGAEFAFRDFLLERHGDLAGINAALGTAFEQVDRIVMPQEAAHYLWFLENRGMLKREFVTRNYIAVADYLLLHGRGIINTVIYCSLAVLLALTVNPLAAYAMSRFKMPSTYKLLLFLMCTMAFPPMVTQIPSFLMLRRLGLLNTFAALVLPGMANGYAIFLLKGFFDSQPRELYESAQLDGASEWTLFWQIAMSLSKPILAVIALQAFTAAYSNFMFAFVVCQDERMWTLMVWLYQLQQRSGQAVMYASLIIAAIPTFLIFLFCQNIIMRGIVVPSEK